MKILKIFIIKEFIQFFRDPKMFRVVLIAPVIQLIFLGYAANRDILNADTALLDLDRSESSREYMRSVEESGYFSVNHYPESYEELKKLIDNGTVFVGIVLPNDFESDIQKQLTADIQLILDGSDGNKASIAAGYIQNITAAYSKNISLEFLQTSGIKVNLVSSVIPEARVWYNPNLSTRNFFLPSIVGLILIIITINMTSLAIVKEREIGTLEQLIVTPLKPYQMILGKLIPFSMIGFVAVILVLSVMRFWFGIEVKGSLLFLFLCTFVFMLSTLGLGLFVSTVSKTQQQAMITSAFLVMMPMIFLSGFSFPIENMPQIIQYITYIIPLKYFIIIIRGIVIKGLGFDNLWKELTILFFMGVFILTISSMRFSKRLE
ncbi:MAG: ABC transporter permease [Ignavibacteria bacterium]|jgi:ABC-2 type transport system permease protein|nr:ABC transporter permease [Ignavibacteria bacterium]